ncbi:MAG: DUF2239 family protein [Planctomycetota bacterium]
MDGRNSTSCTAFVGDVCLATGPVVEVAARVKRFMDAGENEVIVIFDDATSELVEIDFRGSVDDVVSRLSPAMVPPLTSTDVDENSEARRGPGRPKLGVVAREVTLLPRHWEWLNEQSGGASVALRKLVEEARRAKEVPDRQRRARESAYKFLSAMAGNRPNFEEATRALFAGKSAQFSELIETWPEGIRQHAQKLVEGALLPTSELG